MATLLTRSEMEEKLERVFASEQAASLVEIFDAIRQIELERAGDTQDLKQGLTELTKEVKKLTIGQQHLDERLAELVVAQQRTDERLGELAVAQQRTDEHLGELAVAQQRTENALSQLSQVVGTGFTNLRQTVGSLANTFGFSLEEFVAALLPPYLEKHFGLTNLILERRYFKINSNRSEEVDLVGDTQQPGQPVTVLVECRAAIGGGEMRRLARKLEAIAATLSDRKVIKVVVAMNLHPTAEVAAQETGIIAVSYSRINREL